VAIAAGKVVLRRQMIIDLISNWLLWVKAFEVVETLPAPGTPLLVLMPSMIGLPVGLKSAPLIPSDEPGNGSRLLCANRYFTTGFLIGRPWLFANGVKPLPVKAGGIAERIVKLDQLVRLQRTVVQLGFDGLVVRFPKPGCRRYCT